MFHCEQRSLDLSEQSCVADFLRVEQRGALPWRSDWHCKGCELGAVHAGRDVVVLRQAAVMAAARQVCVRCHRPDSRFVGNRLCRSCDARDRELARGRNGKGAFPRLLVERWRLHSIDLRLGQDGVRAVVNRASDVLEAILTLVRRGATTCFSRMPVVECRPRQLSFWGGC